MNMRTLVTFTIGIALAGGAVYAVNQKLQDRGSMMDAQATPAPFETRQILVATNKLRLRQPN